MSDDLLRIRLTTEPEEIELVGVAVWDGAGYSSTSGGVTWTTLARTVTFTRQAEKIVFNFDTGRFIAAVKAFWEAWSAKRGPKPMADGMVTWPTRRRRKRR